MEHSHISGIDEAFYDQEHAEAVKELRKTAAKGRMSFAVFLDETGHSSEEHHDYAYKVVIQACPLAYAQLAAEMSSLIPKLLHTAAQILVEKQHIPYEMAADMLIEWVNTHGD